MVLCNESVKWKGGVEVRHAVRAEMLCAGEGKISWKSEILILKLLSHETL